MQAADVFHLLGKIEFESGRMSSADAVLQQAVRLNPRHWRAMIDLGMFLTDQKRLEEAAQSLERALRINTQSAHARNQLGEVRFAQRKYQEAIKDFKAALAIDRNWLPAAGNLAWILSTCPEEKLRDGRQAVRIALQLVKQTDARNAEAFDTLAAALAETGDYSRAVQAMKRAMEIDQRINQLRKPQARGAIEIV